MGKVIAVASQKGGVGKTTTAINLSACAAEEGKRILLVDIDPQGNATSALGVDKAATARSIYDGLINGLPLSELIVDGPIDGLELVPSSVALAGAEIELVPLERRERRLADLLDTDRTGQTGQKGQKGYDFVLIDCPLSLGLLTVNALTAAGEVVIPLQCEYLALEGLTQLLGAIALVRDNLNPDLEVHGVILTMYDGRTNLCLDVERDVRRHLDGRVYDTVVPRNVRLSEAPSHGLPVARYSPASRGAEAYRRLAAEFRARQTASAARTSVGAVA
jgi:chromosome partitioning protein